MIPTLDCFARHTRSVQIIDRKLMRTRCSNLGLRRIIPFHSVASWKLPDKQVSVVTSLYHLSFAFAFVLGRSTWFPVIYTSMNQWGEYARTYRTFCETDLHLIWLSFISSTIQDQASKSTRNQRRIKVTAYGRCSTDFISFDLWSFRNRDPLYWDRQHLPVAPTISNSGVSYFLLRLKYKKKKNDEYDSDSWPSPLVRRLPRGPETHRRWARGGVSPRGLRVCQESWDRGWITRGRVRLGAEVVRSADGGEDACASSAR